MLKYQLIRSAKRKSIALQVKQGEVIVRAPVFVCAEYIQQLVDTKEPWLTEKLLQQQQTPNHTGVSLAQNGNIWFKGIQKTIQLSFSPLSAIENQPDKFCIVINERYQNQSLKKTSAVIQRQVEQWLKLNAMQLINEKVNFFSLQLNLIPNSITIKRYKARWGSCNNRGELSFNYLLLMTPEWVIDYVVIHELCHLVHLNHSKDFWRLVEHHFPQYKEAKRWLKDHQSQLNWPILEK